METNKKLAPPKDEHVDNILTFLISSENIVDLGTAEKTLDVLNGFEKILIRDCTEGDYENKWKERVETCRELVQKEIEKYSKQETK